MTITPLCGDPAWAEQTALAAAWAHEVSAGLGARRVHLDIEPHALPTWQEQSTRLARGLLAALDAVRAEHVSIDADIPAWYGSVAVDGAPLDQQVMTRLASVTVMAYRDTAEGVLGAAAPTLRAASTGRLPAFIAVNLGPAGPDGKHTTFAGHPASEVWAALSDIEGRGAAWSAFRGLALHDVAHLPGGRPQL